MKKMFCSIVFISLILLSLCGFSLPFSWLFTSTVNPEPPGSHNWIVRETQILKSQADNIDEKVLRLSLIAYVNARRHGLDNKSILTVIDYSKPSHERRLWVFDLKRGRTLYNTWVSHGKNSGQIYATSFSNTPGSLKSSIGVYKTAETYVGNEGYSLRLSGLEPGFNSNAYSRDVVVHGAWYVSPATIKRYGAIGRSWGCPAVDKTLSTPLINTIKGNTVVVAYYPDRYWLSHSRFLNA